METRRKLHNIFKYWKKSTRILHPEKTSFKNEKEVNTFSEEGKIRAYLQQMHLKNGWSSSLNKKETLKEETLEHQEGRKKTVTKNMGKYNRLSFSSWVF